MKRIITVAISFIALAALLAYKINPAFFQRKTLGSFEYVRRAESFLDKSNFQKAIDLFEKAHLSSPENESIKDGLAWAYTKYGDALAGSENHGRAIEYFVKAYETLPSPATVQNLAVAFSKKALSQADHGDWFGAIESFSNARQVAEESNSASRNLAVSLFNDAVTGYRSGKEKIATVCLKESLLVDNKLYALDFLGDIYYRRGDPERASFYWKKALVLESDNPAVGEKLEKAQKEMELVTFERKVALPHFDLKIEKSVAVDAVLIKEILEKAYLDIGRDLNYFLPSKTAVYLYSEGDFRAIFKLPSVVRAFYDGNIRMPLPEGGFAKAELTQYLYHEYTHAVISAMTNNNCPVWFNEGVATWEGLRKQDIPRSILRATLKGEENISVRFLDEAFKNEAGDLSAYYLLAYSAVRFIVEEWGIEGLRDILKRLRDGQHILNAVDDEFLLSEKEFNRRWNGYLHKD